MTKRSVFLGLVIVWTCLGGIPAQAADWYYCDNPPGYYPYISTCNDPWRVTPAQSQAAPQSAPKINPAIPNAVRRIEQQNDATVKQQQQQINTAIQRENDAVQKQLQAEDQAKKEKAQRDQEAAAQKQEQQREANAELNQKMIAVQHEEAVKEAKAKEKRNALEAHQWRIDRQDPDSIFSFLGVTFGTSTPSEAWNFMLLNRAQIPNRPELSLLVGTPGMMTGSFIIVTKKNNQNVGLIYTFPFQEAQAMAKRLVSTYGAPDSVQPMSWQSALGTVIAGTEMFWTTPAGIMQFDDRSEQLNQGRITINPDEALEAKAAIQGVPPDKF